MDGWFLISNVMSPAKFTSKRKQRHQITSKRASDSQSKLEKLRVHEEDWGKNVQRTEKAENRMTVV